MGAVCVVDVQGIVGRGGSVSSVVRVEWGHVCVDVCSCGNKAFDTVS